MARMVVDGDYDEAAGDYGDNTDDVTVTGILCPMTLILTIMMMINDDEGSNDEKYLLG